MDTELIKRKYRRNARLYDWVCRPAQRLRIDAVKRLGLTAGCAVLDLGCGTGLSFELLEAAVGSSGRVIGVELSPEMLARAGRRVAAHGWRNVILHEADGEQAELQPRSVDGVLCFYTHDIMRSAAALGRAFEALRPGGRFVAAGAKKTSGLRGLFLNRLTKLYSSPFVSRFQGAERPWETLERILGAIEISDEILGTAYIATGIKRSRPGA